MVQNEKKTLQHFLKICSNSKTSHVTVYLKEMATRDMKRIKLKKNTNLTIQSIAFGQKCGS